MESLKSLTADQLIKLLSQDVVDILKNSARKGTAYLVTYNEKDDCVQPYTIMGKYKDTVPKDVPYRIMRDSNLYLDPDSCEPSMLFYHLLFKNEDLMKGHKIFDDYFKWKGTPEDSDVDYYRPEFVELLYTKIKKPEDLIKDLQNVDFGDRCRDCFVVFESDSYWQNSIKWRCQSKFGITYE